MKDEEEVGKLDCVWDESIYDGYVIFILRVYFI